MNTFFECIQLIAQISAKMAEDKATLQLVHQMAETKAKPAPTPKAKNAQKTGATSPEVESKHIDLHRRLLNHLQERYELRYNLLTEEPEYRPRESGGAFETIDRRALNTLVIETVDEGLGAWTVDVDRLLYSHHLPVYHPLSDYLEHLPEWDGTDRVQPLAQRISHSDLWVEGFHTWLRAMVAQWMGMETTTANALVPLLISRRQGMRKSTFCRMLMPSELTAYYTEHLNLTAAGNVEPQLAKLGLINLDEFDRYTSRQTAMLKNLLQLPRICRRKAYRQQFLSLPRMASFIATSNEREILTDPTGSRRFLCVEINKPIDCSPIDHAQLFAQLKAELLNDAPTFLSLDFEERLQAQNRSFQVLSPASEVFWQLFRLPAHHEKPLSLTATAIFEELRRRHPSALRTTNPVTFGRLLRSLGVQSRHSKKGSVYRVVRR